jgi:hypothetical protein
MDVRYLIFSLLCGDMLKEMEVSDQLVVLSICCWLVYNAQYICLSIYYTVVYLLADED